MYCGASWSEEYLIFFFSFLFAFNFFARFVCVVCALRVTAHTIDTYSTCLTHGHRGFFLLYFNHFKSSFIREWFISILMHKVKIIYGGTIERVKKICSRKNKTEKIIFKNKSDNVFSSQRFFCLILSYFWFQILYSLFFSVAWQISY